MCVCVCVCVCVCAGIGRFNNQTYVEFLRSWNTTRRIKTKIGPAEVSLSQETLWVWPVVL